MTASAVSTNTGAAPMAITVATASDVIATAAK